VQQLREFIKLLGAIRQPVEEHRGAIGCRAVIVESRIRARVDRRVRGVARDQSANAVARLGER
jgi:hypothetical protein